MFKKIFIVGLCLIVAYLILFFLPFFISDRLFIFPVIRDDKYAFLNRLEVYNACDPLPCQNFYILFPKEVILKEDIRFCETNSISGNRFLGYGRGGQVSNFGKGRGNCRSDTEVVCKAGWKALVLSLFSLLPLPSKEEDFFYCGYKP